VTIKSKCLGVWHRLRCSSAGTNHQSFDKHLNLSVKAFLAWETGRVITASSMSSEDYRLLCCPPYVEGKSQQTVVDENRYMLSVS
jgi:hypothetical protein